MTEFIGLAISGLISLGFTGIRAGGTAGYNYLRDRRNRRDASEFLDSRFNAAYMRRLVKNWHEESNERDWNKIVLILTRINSGLLNVKAGAQADYDTLNHKAKEILAPLIELDKKTIIRNLSKFASEYDSGDIEEISNEPEDISGKSEETQKASEETQEKSRDARTFWY